MLQCSKRENIRKKFLHDVKLFIEKYDSDRYLNILILRLLKKLLNNDPIIIDDYEQKYSRLIRNQELIGWEQILKGRFALKWSELIDDHISGLPIKPPKSFSGESWTIGISQLIFNYAWNVWTDRNEDRHGRDATEKANRRLEKAIRCTSSLYRFQSEVLPVHRKIFYSSVEDHLNKETTTTQLESWITTWSSVIFRSVQRAKELGIARTRDITQYFTSCKGNLN